VLVDGISTTDVSNTSVDNATTIDPLTAERIEVLRGPAVLLFGSQAIGGAVNVIDKRIPLRRMTEPFHLRRGFCCRSSCRHCPYGYDAKSDRNIISKQKKDDETH
jgi:outer membrane receptor for Fe3+-dicitrate